MRKLMWRCQPSAMAVAFLLACRASHIRTAPSTSQGTPALSPKDADEGRTRQIARAPGVPEVSGETRAGGWLKQGERLRGRQMVCYHKEWDYFSRAFGIPCVDYIEAKPGIPPTPRHVADVIDLMRREHIPVLFSTNYYDRGQVESVARRTQSVAVVVPSNVDGAPGTGTCIDLVGAWVRELAAALGGVADSR